MLAALAVTGACRLPHDHSQELKHTARLALKRHSLNLGSTNLSDCVNLAIAHTGSSWLSEALIPLSPALVHHDHNQSLAKMRQMGVRCVISTLRDPATRLIGAFKFELKRYKPDSRKLREYAAPTPAQLVRALMSIENLTALTTSENQSVQQQTGHLHATLNAVWKTGARPAFARYASAMRTANWSSIDPQSLGFPGSITGTAALLPQLSYLAGLGVYEDVEVHFLCTCRLTEDFRTLLLSQVPAGNATIAHPLQPPGIFLRLPVDHRRYTVSEQPLADWFSFAPIMETKKNVAGNFTKDRNLADPYSLSDEEANYVRECMFPEDAWLERQICA